MLPLASLDDLTLAWLTTTLAEHGVLSTGCVLAYQMRSNTAFNSSIAHLELAYSAAAPADAPRALLIKHNANGDGELEAGFYQLVAMLPTVPPMLVPCYAALYDPTSGNSTCLLQDLSATHATPTERADVLALRGVPTDTQFDQIVDALAQFHAFWWEHPRFGSIPKVLDVRPWYRDAAFHDQHVQRRTNEWQQFISAEGPWFPADLRALYEHALDQLPLLWERYLALRMPQFQAMTLSNGDCYFAQFLCPTVPGTNQAYIVDWQDVSVNLDAYDLVYLFATFWTSPQRREHGREERLLRRYLDQLRAHGVASYTWDTLLVDYRLMIAYMLFDPIWNAASGSSKSYWWPKLQCLVAAYRDLNCAQF